MHLKESEEGLQDGVRYNHLVNTLPVGVHCRMHSDLQAIKYQRTQAKHWKHFDLL